jgi:hypothetical protein
MTSVSSVHPDPSRVNSGGRYSDRTYTEFGKEPCPICKSKGWCSKVDDGSAIFCRRNADGAIYKGRDKNGADFYVHSLQADEDHPPRVAARSSPKAKGGSDSSGEKNNELGLMTLPEGVLPSQKPVFEGLIRENAFESGYRERELCEIALSLPKTLFLLDYRRLR